MTRIAELIKHVERGESVDLDRLAELQSLDLAHAGETFAAEMIEQIEGGALRYGDVDSVEFYENGLIRRVVFREEVQLDKGTVEE